VLLDGSYREVMTVKAQRGLPADLHEFIITPEGIAYFTGQAARWDRVGATLGGVVVQPTQGPRPTK